MKLNSLKAVVVVLSLFLTTCAFSKVVNVKDYGAVGNGTTNDTKPFTAAIKALSKNDTLHIPSGKYLIEQIRLNNLANITILGSGELVAANRGGSYFLVITKCPFIKLNGITIEGNHNKNLGIDIHDSHNGEITNVKIRNIQGAGHNWSAGVRLRRNNSHFKISNTKVVDISSRQNAAIGIFILSYENEDFSRNVKIQNCEISNIDSPQDADGIKIQQIGRNSEIEIQKCTFNDNRTRAVKVQTDNVKIIGNNVKRTEVSKNGLAVFSVYGNNVEVTANEFISFGNSSVNMFADISAMKNVVIKNNTHQNSINSTTKIRDFILTKYHPSEKSVWSRGVIIENNKVSNVRNFLRVRSNLEGFEIKNNKVNDLESNFIFVVDDKKINSVFVKEERNNISFKNFKYMDVKSPARIKVIQN